MKDLVGFWNFEEGQGETVFDLSEIIMGLLMGLRIAPIFQNSLVN